MLKTYFKNLTKRRSEKSKSFLDIPFLRGESDDRVGAESYKNNAIVHRCVSLIASSASHVPWQIYKNNNGERKLQKNHPSVRLLKNPNPEKSGADFFTQSISTLLLYGSSYMLLGFDKKGKPARMYNLHPNNVEFVHSKNHLVGYRHRAGGQEQIFHIDPATRMSHILHLKNYNPTNPEAGSSSLSAAGKSINLHSKIMDWNKSLLRNAIRPSGALVFQDGNGYLTDEQFSRLQQQFYDNFSGSSNSGKPLILEGGLKWQETSNAEKFEKFIDLKDSSAREIAIAFNVPPQLLGITGDNTYSNMQEARFALWEENLMPLLDKYADALGSWFSCWFGEELIVDFDRDSISILGERRENLWAKIASADFMTINEKREFVGLDPIQGGERLNSHVNNDNEQ
ncbi:MAG: phage portal protein [Rickettsiales bacterium]|nr:MAG: phage portal protein [Rickettsiales bacterium]